MGKTGKIMPFLCEAWRHTQKRDVVGVLRQGKACDRCGGSLVKPLTVHDVRDIYEQVADDMLEPEAAKQELQNMLAQEKRQYHKQLAKKNSGEAIDHMIKADFIQMLLNAW